MSPMSTASIQIPVFPDPREAEPEGLVAVGGDFGPEMLIGAYAQGIFPWPTDETPYVWYSPDPRTVLVPEDFHVPRRLRRTIRQGQFDVTFDTAFDDVVQACMDVERPGQPGTWITDELRDGFVELHRLGLAHSAEAWQDGELVGGVYGLALGRMFCGESMFHHVSDASKVALHALVEKLKEDDYLFLDCQIPTPHMERHGAVDWSRDRFLDEVEKALEAGVTAEMWA